jgi:hypothetical protein
MSGFADIFGQLSGPIGAGVTALAGREQPDPYYTRPGSGAQMNLFQMLIKRAMTGQGEYGFGPAARTGAATLKQQMGNTGNAPGSPVYNSALAQMLAGYGAQDEGARRNFALQAATMQPWTVTGQQFNPRPVGY